MAGDLNMNTEKIRWIPITALLCALFYIIVMIWQSISVPEILPAAITGSLLLAVLASLFFVRNEKGIHIGETVLLWAMVMSFVVYGVLRLMGVL